MSTPLVPPVSATPDFTTPTAEECSATSQENQMSEHGYKTDIAGMLGTMDQPMTDDELRARPALTWGRWRYDRARRVLTFGAEYEVDLDRCSTSGQVLDWI